MDKVIRFATPDDADRIGEIHIAAWRVAYRGIIPDAHLDSLSVEERVVRWRDILEEKPKIVLVHEQGGRVEGWVSIGPGRDDDATNDGEIYGFYVDPASWRTGVGRVLMENAEVELRSRGFSRLFLWVLKQNDRARRFYESMGYSPDGGTKVITIGGASLPELRYTRK